MLDALWAVFAWCWWSWGTALDSARWLGPLVALIIFATKRSPSSASRGNGDSAPRAVPRRAARLDAPAHTMQALRYCIERGCKEIEFDVSITKDGKCILYHDTKINDKVVSNSNWSELKDIPIEEDHPMSAKFGVTNLCLLNDAVEYLLDNKIKFIMNVNLLDKKLISAIIEAFKSRPEMFDSGIVSSLNPLIIYWLRLKDNRIVGALSYRPKCFSMISYNVNTYASRKRFPGNIFLQIGVRILDELYYLIWSTRILAYWCGCTVIILHKDIASPTAVDVWRDSKYSVYLWGVNNPLDKLYAAKILRVPYITDTLTGEPNTVGEMNGKSH